MTLNSSIRDLKGIGDKTAALFEKINIETVQDALLYYPRTYIQYPEPKHADEVTDGEMAALIGRVAQTPVVKRVRSMQIP